MVTHSSSALRHCPQKDTTHGDIGTMKWYSIKYAPCTTCSEAYDDASNTCIACDPATPWNATVEACGS